MFFLQMLINGIVVGSIYGLVALGFVLIYRASGALNLANGEFVLFGPYVCLVIMTALNVPFLVAFIGTLLFSAFLGLVVERLVIRQLQNAPTISVIMATLGLSSLLAGAVHIIWGHTTRTFPPVFPQTPLNIGGIIITPVYLWSFIIVMILLVIFSIFFKYSKIGLAMRAVADDRQAALSMGMSVKFVLAMTWMIASMVAAIGGILLGNINGVSPTMSAIGLTVLPVVILGGLDSVMGAIIGGFLIGIIQNLAGGYLDPLVGGGLKDVVPFIVVLLILMLKPHGLFGSRGIERV
ncbi:MULTISPECIES: branched-chain amino acid ABC transporter permease [Ureibacillus]|jgi:branched-chain amino acid transport system permease protein|uniref:Branched-chain amino acid transport system permease protein n=1 Tax=Ureibacillus thermosphaericus TaxID=51173 RepID=A0A840PYQ8_URETH|nr:branched-chain amino acid ABC transporter permease [Ureibacillus thermosphaericus]MBB5150444.1 branched-chain amino acid transport system permease protein [Ureibacillus thermosphaericus]NKZ33062.1 branched-chain amino acid ABC transporter permease [Ureibacillus thermosphaericus]